MGSILWRIPPCGLKWGNSLLLSVSTLAFAFVSVSIDNNSMCISICSSQFYDQCQLVIIKIGIDVRI